MAYKFDLHTNIFDIYIFVFNIVDLQNTIQDKYSYKMYI